MWLMAAMGLSMTLHFVVLYVDILSTVFQITPLSMVEWIAVLKMSVPVVLLDEGLKFVARRWIEGNSNNLIRKRSMAPQIIIAVIVFTGYLALVFHPYFPAELWSSHHVSMSTDSGVREL